MLSVVGHKSYKEDIIVLFTFIDSPNILIVKTLFYPSEEKGSVKNKNMFLFDTEISLPKTDCLV